MPGPSNRASSGSPRTVPPARSTWSCGWRDRTSPTTPRCCRSCWRSRVQPDVSALTCDVFGTVVDWRTGVIAEATKLGNARGIEGDWARLADAWRGLYLPYMARVRLGELPWTNFDRLHRASLDEVLSDLGIEGFSQADKEELTLAWERLPPWPDSI